MLIGMADQVADQTKNVKYARPDSGNMSASSMQQRVAKLPLKQPKLSGKGSDISGYKFGLNTANQIQYVSIFGQNKNEDFNYTKN